jgi:multimeric flavodoxin WrbA
MKVVAFNGSARKDGNTAILVRQVFSALEEEGIETELIELAGKPVQGCDACYRCRKERNRRCAIEDDVVNDCIGKMDEAEGILLASPTYFADVSAKMKALMERAGLVAMANDVMFRRKVGAAVVAVRRGGAIHAFDTLNHFFLISEMIVPGSRYWNIGIGLDRGDVRNDEEGMRTMRVLGENMAWVMKKLYG